MLGRDIATCNRISQPSDMTLSIVTLSTPTTYTVTISTYVTHFNRSTVEDILLENVCNVAMSVLYAYGVEITCINHR